MSTSEERSPKALRLDHAAESKEAGQPAFLTPPDGAPVYHGFPLIDATRTDGWCYGAITEFEEADGCEWGDGFVQAPDGSRAGVEWHTGTGEVVELIPPEPGRWGVYGVCFPRPVRTVDDLVDNFRQVLPALQAIYASIQPRS